MAERLTPKQQAFVDFYLGTARGNGSEAARLAGYKDAEVSAFDCKQNQAIRAQIDERLLARSLSSAEVLDSLTEVARADWRDFVQVRYGQEGQIVDAKILLGDKVKALELLGKYHRLFAEKVEHSGPDGGPIHLQFEAMQETELHERARIVLLDAEDGLCAGDSAPLRITGTD